MNVEDYAEIVAYLSDNYLVTEIYNGKSLQIVTENILRNKPLAEKITVGKVPSPVVFFVKNSGKGKTLYENQDELFKGSKIFVGVDLTDVLKNQENK